MSKTLYCGCSYVHGSGFALAKNEPGLWVNLLHSSGFFDHSELINVGRAGRSNQGIFLDAVHNLLQDRYDFAFVSWTSVPRYELELGLETYDTHQTFTPNLKFLTDHRLNDIVYSQSYLRQINDRFTSLAHLHYEIFQLLLYVNCLIKLAALQGTRLFFINSICPWDRDYFSNMHYNVPEQYTVFTKKILNIDSRDNDEIFKLYKKIHTEYQAAGGIQEDHWLNLYQSLKSLQIDTNNDGTHPGIRSNQIFCDVLTASLQDKLQISY